MWLRGCRLCGATTDLWQVYEAEPPAPVPAEPTPGGLLPPQEARDAGRICLVLDLDETLVHSSFRVRAVCGASPQPVHNPDYIVPVEIEGVVH